MLTVIVFVLRQVSRWLRMILSLVGLPLLGWWIAGRLMPNPPIVAPFLLVSPLYAIIVCGAIIWGHKKERFERLREPVSSEVDEKTKVALLPEEAGVSQTLLADGWLYVNEDLWRKLSEEGRDYLLARGRLGRPNNWMARLLTAMYFVGGYVLACINLWFVPLVHISYGIYVGILVVTKGQTHILAADERAFRITRNLKGALEYIRQTELDTSRRLERMEALRNLA